MGCMFCTMRDLFCDKFNKFDLSDEDLDELAYDIVKGHSRLASKILKYQHTKEDSS